MVSADIQWQVIRKTSSFLRRQRGIPKHFSRERFNIKGVNSIRFNGLVHKKGLDIQAAPDGKGIVVTMKKRTKNSFPTKSSVSITLKKNSRKSLKSVRNIARSYRIAHRGLAQKRASQLLRSLKPVDSRRGRRGRHVRKAEV
ncbi:ribosomal protein L28e [Loa loa]|uniref:Large ribosomal subunit protein eL28 n=1 Tax=Loa loa TaxID=7209 RepID=A0A1I7W2V4_LOALO|nr:ribosomal protein L28e [Loa loa]EFO25472.1 ribosomal protein L28e [Loa loa]